MPLPPSARVRARRVLLAGTALLVAVGALPSAAAASPARDGGAVRLVVAFAEDTTAEERAAVADAADVEVADDGEALEPLGFAVVEAGAADAVDAVAALRDDPRVEAVERDQPATVDAAPIERLPSDPSTTYALSAYRQSQLPAAWARTTGRPTVTIAVVDDGVDVGHPDLAGRLEPGYDVLNRSTTVTDWVRRSPPEPSHGTKSALLVGARADDGFGSAGVCWQCRVRPVSVATRSGQLWVSNIAEGIVEAVDERADIVSVAMSAPSESSALKAAVAHAAARDVLVVASAGNEANDRRRYPAAYPEVVGVAGAGDDQAKRHPDSTYSPSWVSLAAPYEHVVASRDGVAYYYDGSSSATSAVAGIAGLVASEAPHLSAPALRAALEATAVDADYVRHGHVDAAAALASVMGDRWTTAVLPATPANVAVRQSRDGVEVRWEHTSTWPADFFTVTVEPGGDRYTVSGNARSTVLADLSSLHGVRLLVRAHNAAGASPPGEAGVAPPSPPPPPEPPDEEVKEELGYGPTPLPEPPTSGPRTAFLGDWDGDGVATPGWFQAGRWYLRNTPLSGGTEVHVAYGTGGDLPVVGDWDGDGRDGIGVRRGTEMHLSNSADTPRTSYRFRYGGLGQTVLAGDWNGDRRDTVAVRNGAGKFYLRHSNATTSGYAALGFGFGSDVPVAGDWDGDGHDTVGVYRGGTWYLAKANRHASAYTSVGWGVPTDRPVVGPLQRGHRDSLGAVRGNEWWLRAATRAETFGRIDF